MKKKTKIIAFVASAILTFGVLKATVKRPHFSNYHHKFMKDHHSKCDKSDHKHEKNHDVKLEHLKGE